jgi:hypothetical protein
VGVSHGHQRVEMASSFYAQAKLNFCRTDRRTLQKTYNLSQSSTFAMQTHNCDELPATRGGHNE